MYSSYLLIPKNERGEDKGGGFYFDDEADIWPYLISLFSIDESSIQSNVGNLGTSYICKHNFKDVGKNIEVTFTSHLADRNTHLDLEISMEDDLFCQDTRGLYRFTVGGQNYK